MKNLYSAYQTLWSGEGYRSPDNEGYDDRGNAVAVLSGLCPEEKYHQIENVLFNTRNSSPYMEYYLLESLCRMGRYSLAENRMCERYREMIDENYSTLWENWIKNDGTSNHAWTGGPLVIMSKHIAGIRPVSAGYKEFEIKPQYDLHRSVFCTVPTVNGLIKFKYESDDNRVVVNLEYPEQCKVKLHIPQNAVVSINGEVKETDSLIIVL